MLFKKEVYKPGGLFTEKEIEDYNYLMHVEQTRQDCKDIARKTVIKGLFDFLSLHYIAWEYLRKVNIHNVVTYTRKNK